MMQDVRTTLTLDDHLAEKLKDLATRRGVSFRKLVNELLLAALSRPDRPAKRPKPFVVDTFKSPFRPGVDAMKLNQLLGELEVNDAVGTARR